MRVIGVDLAWAERNPTGLCVVEHGRVLDSTTLVTGDDVEGWIRAWWTDEVLLAIDAPIVVANDDGRRPCEDVLGAAFRREEAGPYPANRRRLGAVTRALALARRLDLDVAPEAARRRPVRAVIEVYPHPALVCLHGLDRTLKYKANGARTVAARRRAFARLVACLTALRSREPALDVASSAAWPRLRRGLRAATTHAALDRLEDELDAYVCAYVGLHHLRWAGVRSLVVGDAIRGYIVTPVDTRHAALVRRCAAERRVPAG
jgi:predicted RNase H-like nuclease